MENDIVYGLSEISLYLSNIGKDDFAQTIEDACKKLELLKEQEKRINELEEKLRTLEHGDADLGASQSAMIPTTAIWRKFYDGWFEYYYNIETGERKSKLDPDDILLA